MRKKGLSLLLALLLAVQLLPATVWAADHDGQVHVIVENTTFTPDTAEDVEAEWKDTFWYGTLVDTWVTLDESSTMMSCVVTALEENGYTQRGAESNYISEINGLKAYDGGFMSGWMGTLNDWFTNQGFGAYTVADGTLSAGDEIRIMYTCSYGEDLGSSWGSKDTRLSALSFSAGTLEPVFNPDVTAYTLTVPATVTGVVVTPTAANKNYQVRTRVGDQEYKRTQTVPVTDGTQIVVESNWTDVGSTYTITVKTVPVEPQDVSALLQQALDSMAATVTEPQFGTAGGEWAIISLARSGYYAKDSQYFADYYDRIVDTVNQLASSLNMNGALDRNKSTENSRLILALSAIGIPSDSVGDWNLLAPFENNFTWITRQGINGPIFTLLALDSHDYELTDTTVRQQCIDYILGKQCADGGWALFGSQGDPDITAMALQALAPYVDDAKVGPAVEAGVACLSKMQMDNGGFASWGTENCESIAQVMVACTALGINPDTDSRFVKSGGSLLDALLRFYDAETGMFRHIMSMGGDQIATEQGVYALVAYDRLLEGKTSLYDMSDVTFPEEDDAAALAAAKEAAKAELEDYKNPADYREAQQKELADAIAQGKAAIDQATDTSGVASALSAAKAAMDAIKTDAQLTAEENQNNPGTKPEDKPVTSPDTGDHTPVELLAALLVLCAAGMVVTIGKRRASR